ncbi:MAG TPA: ATP-binding SpoIIE family protein phosphatase [Streptosporangiaceae bacterium]|nr:ATP-binding SpoIIE family protein phosphatase [Streptosporangiaceae bacterium]
MTEAPAATRSTREWLAYLAGATESIGSSLDLEQVAAGFAAAVVPALADHAVVYLSDYLLREADLLPERGRLADSVRMVATAGTIGGSGVTVPPVGWLALASQGGAGPIVLPETHSGAAVLFPLRVRGMLLGFAVWFRLTGSFLETELLVGGQLATQSALSMHDAYLYRREAATVDVLQRDMLTAEPPDDMPGIQIAQRYLPGSPAARVGGDWFDTIRLRGGRVALIVGDVAGHGIRSAATMGRLRTVMRTLIALDLPPAEVLQSLDAIALSEEGTMATCLYCLYDPVTRQCSISNAGHIPPVLHVPGEQPRLLEIPAGGPIGVGGINFQTVDVTTPDGSLIVMCTDGLVERRDRELGLGLAELCQAIGEQPTGQDLEERCDGLLHALGAGSRADDVALLAANLSGIPADRVAYWIMSPSARSPQLARRLVRGLLEKWKLPESIDTATLLVSELVTNAVRYASRPISVRLMLTDSLLCEVHDDDPHLPVLDNPRPTEEGGRGILLVSRLARRWGVTRISTGKVVWFEL